MEIKGVIFDMDGVITDSENYAVKCMHEVFDEEGIQWDFNFYKRLLGANERGFISICSELFGTEEKSQEILDRFVKKLYKGFDKKEIKFKKGAIELINFLKQHNFPICLATSSGDSKISHSFASNDMEIPFEHIVTGEMVHYSKPNPEIFMIAAKKLGLDIHDCMIIEDSYNGMEAAIKAGAISTMVPDLLEPTEYIKEHATFIKKDLCEVLDLIKQYANL